MEVADAQEAMVGIMFLKVCGVGESYRNSMTMRQGLGEIQTLALSPPFRVRILEWWTESKHIFGR